MKHLRSISLVVCAGFLAACESTETAGGPGRAEKREMANRRAAQQQLQQAQPDEAQQNLWGAQQNVLNRDGNPMRSP